MEKKKIIVQDQWAEKYLRETPFMPFGSLCNLIGQAYQGKGISIEELEALATKAFELSLKFTQEAYEAVSKVKEESEPEVPINESQ